MANTNNQKEAKLSIIIKPSDILEEAEVTIETNDEYEALKNRINLGNTFIDPIIDKIEEHIAEYAMDKEFAEKQLHGFENTLFNISIHFDEENIFFTDYITKPDEELYAKYDLDYIEIKEKLLCKISEAVYDFNNDMKAIIEEHEKEEE